MGKDETIESGPVEEDSFWAHIREHHGPSEALEVGAGVFVVVEQATGKLFICDKCDEYTWKCREDNEGSTICRKVCISWTCREVPASFTRALVRALN
jgi:hypothetical protein